MAAAGDQAESAMHAAMEENYGNYLLLVDGSIPMKETYYGCAAGKTHYDTLVEAAAGAAAIVAIGTCAAYGGIPKANPNPTGAVGVGEAPHETTGFVGGIDEPVEVEPVERLEDRAEGEE